MITGRWSLHILLTMVLLLSSLLLAAEAGEPARPPKEQPIGWLSVSIQGVGEELAERLAATFGVESGTGVLVLEAIRGGPAEAAGLKPSDVIVKLDNQPIWEVRQLQKIISASAPGRSIRLTILRGRERVQVSVTVGHMPEGITGQLAGERLGFFARSRAGEAPEKEVLEKPEEEIRVMLVEPGSPAPEAGMRPQDLLVKIGEQDIRSLEDMAKALRLRRAGEGVSIQVIRDGERHVFSLKVPLATDNAESR
jgi:serine protease Do